MAAEPEPRWSDRQVLPGDVELDPVSLVFGAASVLALAAGAVNTQQDAVRLGGIEQALENFNFALAAHKGTPAGG